MAAVNICSDFGAQENKICHCFSLLWSQHVHEPLGASHGVRAGWRLLGMQEQRPGGLGVTNAVWVGVAGRWVCDVSTMPSTWCGEGGAS